MLHAAVVRIRRRAGQEPTAKVCGAIVVRSPDPEAILGGDKACPRPVLPSVQTDFEGPEHCQVPQGVRIERGP